jgi:5-methylcytosine-specific restriction protein A
MEFFIASSPEHQRREKLKGRELRSSQWWKNQLGRGICHHCGQRFHPSQLTMDHLFPIGRGGQSTKGNVVTSCKPCNTQKGYKTALDSAFEELKNRDSYKQLEVQSEAHCSAGEGEEGSLDSTETNSIS